MRAREKPRRLGSGRGLHVSWLGGREHAKYKSPFVRDQARPIALQFGCDPQTLRTALTHEPNGDASGPLGKIIDIVEGGAS